MLNYLHLPSSNYLQNIVKIKKKTINKYVKKNLVNFSEMLGVKRTRNKIKVRNEQREVVKC